MTQQASNPRTLSAPIPVSVAKNIAEQFGKDYVIITAWNDTDLLTRIITFGKSQEQAEIASCVGILIAEATGSELKTEEVVHEDYLETYECAITPLPFFAALPKPV